MSFPSRRAFLREATSKAHADLDALVGPFETRAAYEAYCLGLYAFRAPLEPMIGALAGDVVGGDWRPCMVAREVEQDLADFGLTPPRRRPVEAPASRDEAVGYLYVLEGSNLGARFLVKRASDLGLSAEWGARHLFKQAAAGAGFRVFAEALETPELDPELMRLGAEAAFHAAHEAMGRALNA